MSDGRLVERSSSLIAMSHGRLGECSGLMTVVTSESIKTCDGEIVQPGDTWGQSVVSCLQAGPEFNMLTHISTVCLSVISLSLSSVSSVSGRNIEDISRLRSRQLLKMFYFDC